MQSFLRLNQPWQGTGNASTWRFSGADERALRDCLDQLDRFTAERVGDRWTAVIVYGPADQRGRVSRRGRKLDVSPGTPERAWTIDGALALADLLPESLADLRAELVESFTRRKQGWLGDAATSPRREL
jgi:hypothetical protein